MHRYRNRGFTLLELIVCVVIVSILLGLILPVLARNREGGHTTSCRSNLKQLGTAMFMYADDPANKIFPTTGHTKDPFAAPAMSSLNLLYNGYIADPRVFSCPNRPIDAGLLNLIAKVDANGKPLGRTTLSSANCSYGYDPGHSTNDATVALAADRKGNGANSDNHGPNGGQNVLIGGGTVLFMDSPKYKLNPTRIDNDIYALNPEIPRNDDGYIRQNKSQR